jgi:LuxR family maltose regulon positive regulatory protein
VTLARILLGHDRLARDGRSLEQATGLLERLLRAALEGGRAGSAIEILILAGLVRSASGDDRAPGLIEQALTMAEPERYVRLFVDHGPPMAVLLRAAAKRGVTPAYTKALLSAFDAGPAAGPIVQLQIEPLSERELDVLRLLGTDLSGPDIASELVVSLHTVRSHTKSIYAKLGVNSRRAAVSRAVELNLLSRSREP